MNNLQFRRNYHGTSGAAKIHFSLRVHINIYCAVIAYQMSVQDNPQEKQAL